MVLINKSMRGVVFAVVLLPFALEAETPAPHRFLDRTNIALHSINIASQGLDYYSTERALKKKRTFVPCPTPIPPNFGDCGLRPPQLVELNPFGQSREARIALKAGAVVGALGLAYGFHRAEKSWTPARKLERAMPLIVAGPSFVAATLNFRW